MNLQKYSSKIYFFGMICVSMFIVLTILAMLVYAGGTIDNPSKPGYSFFENFFSDLGLTTSHSGQSNTLAFVLFSFSALCMGIELVAFYLVWHNLFSEDDLSHKISISGSVLGIIAGIGFIGVSLTPYDLLLNEHVLSVRIGFFFSFLATILYTIVLFRNQSYSKKYAYLFLTLAVLSCLYLILLFFGPSTATINGLVMQVTGQKIIIYSMGICYFIQGYGAWKLVNA